MRSPRTLFTAVIFFLLGFSIMLPRNPFAFADPSTNVSAGLVGWISVEPIDGGPGQGQVLGIAGRALALHPLRGRYSLDVKRRGKGGVSNTRQGGAISLEPGTAAVLSQSSINIGPADTLDIELKIYVDDREVFSASMKSASGATTRNL